jgi:hypothetical protein
MYELKFRVLNSKLKTQQHHIIPKCMGGSDNDTNIVELSIEEHINAHKELANCFDVGTYERNSNLSAANVLYVWLNKKSDINLIGINNPMYGKKHTDETKEKIGKKSKQKIFTDEYRNKLSLAFMGNKNHRYGVKLSNETKKKISESQSGQKHHLWGKSRSNETKQKIGNSQPNKIIVTKCDIKLNKIKKYESISSAANDNDVSSANLSAYFKKPTITKYGNYRMLGGYVWIKE